MKKLLILAAVLPLAVFGCGDDTPPTATGTGTGSTTGTGTPGTGSDTTSTTGTTDTGGDTGPVQQCTPGDAFCNGSTLFTCKPDGSDLTSQTCENGCDGGKCKAGCQPNQSACKADGKTVVTCDAQGVETEQLCETKCDQGACVEKLCEPNQILCEIGGKKLVKCSPDGLSAETHDICPYGCVEEAAECSDPACDEGEKRCAPDSPLVVELCKADQTGWKKADAPCKEECEEGECIVKFCTPDEEQCGALGTEVCNAEGSAFESIEPCKWGCLVTEAGPVCALCKDGQVECNDNAVVECSDPVGEGFKTIKECTELQQCENGDCLDVLVLDGSLEKEGNYLLLLKAFIDCYEAAVDGLCRGIDSTAIDYLISEKDISDWFCDDKDGNISTLFDSEEQYAVATNVMGCGTFDFQDYSFDVEEIEPNQKDYVCIGYSSALAFTDTNSKEVIVKPCADF